MMMIIDDDDNDDLSVAVQCNSLPPSLPRPLLEFWKEFIPFSRNPTDSSRRDYSPVNVGFRPPERQHAMFGQQCMIVCMYVM